jgi:hypothetical protein
MLGCHLHIGQQFTSGSLNLLGHSIGIPGVGSFQIFECLLLLAAVDQFAKIFGLLVIQLIRQTNSQALLNEFVSLHGDLLLLLLAELAQTSCFKKLLVKHLPPPIYI